MDFNLKDVERHWDKTLNYDEINKQAYSYWRRFTDGYRVSNIRDGAYILDVCCRTGNGTLYFAKRKKIKVVCMDVSSKMLNIAKEILEKEKIDFQIKKLTSETLLLDNEIFDYVISFETLEHMPNPKKFIMELSRVLKPKGGLLLTTPNTVWEFIHTFAAITGIHHSEGPHRFIPRGEIIQHINEAGFKIKKEETTVLVPIGPKFLIKIGDFFEKIFKNNIMKYVGLRRIFVCEKI